MRVVILFIYLIHDYSKSGGVFEFFCTSRTFDLQIKQKYQIPNWHIHGQSCFGSEKLFNWQNLPLPFNLPCTRPRILLSKFTILFLITYFVGYLFESILQTYLRFTLFHLSNLLIINTIILYPTFSYTINLKLALKYNTPFNY